MFTQNSLHGASQLHETMDEEVRIGGEQASTTEKHNNRILAL